MSEEKRKKVGRPGLTPDERADRIELAKKVFGSLSSRTGLSNFKLEQLLDLDSSTIGDAKSGWRPLTYSKAAVVMKEYLRVTKAPTELEIATAEIPVRLAMEKLLDEFRATYLLASQQLKEAREVEMAAVEARYALREKELHDRFVGFIIRAEDKVQFGHFLSKPARFPK